MSIITKTGDEGNTSLWSGQRVPKDHIRVEAYGTVDELGSYISESRHICLDDQVIKDLCSIQDYLFLIAGELATVGTPFRNPITAEAAQWVTNRVHEYEKRLPLKGFVVPGCTYSAAKLDICRAICRRMERRVVSLHRQNPVSVHMLQFINRLSDLFFMLARSEEAKEGKITPKKPIA